MYRKYDICDNVSHTGFHLAELVIDLYIRGKLAKHNFRYRLLAKSMKSVIYIYDILSAWFLQWEITEISTHDPNEGLHDDVSKWKRFPRYWPFERGIHRSPVNSPHKGQWRGALMFSLICVWINSWVNNREAGDLRRYRAHYDVIVMLQEIKIMCRGVNVRVAEYSRCFNWSNCQRQNNCPEHACGSCDPIIYIHRISWVINQFITVVIPLNEVLVGPVWHIPAVHSLSYIPNCSDRPRHGPWNSLSCTHVQCGPIYNRNYGDYIPLW